MTDDDHTGSYCTAACPPGCTRFAITRAPEFAERLRQAVIRERVAVSAWRARRAADTANAWWDAADEVDHLIDELEARGTR
jgi:hypothetical protein